MLRLAELVKHTNTFVSTFCTIALLRSRKYNYFSHQQAVYVAEIVSYLHAFLDTIRVSVTVFLNVYTVRFAPVSWTMHPIRMHEQP